MIPVQLHIENFLSHKKSTLNFDSLGPVTLIVGSYNNNTNKSNGAGKSSIFDAITWCLFDKSRISGTKHVTIDDLIRQGSTKCEVTLDFKVKDVLYRICRSRDSKRGKTDISLQSFNGTKFGNAVSGKNAQSKVLELIGMDYDIYTNSVFFRQGEVAALAKMNGTQRKEVVSKILQFNRYDDYQKTASSKAYKIEQEILSLSRVLNSDEEEPEEVLKKLKNDLQNIKDHISASEKSLKITKEALELERNAQTKFSQQADKIRNLKNDSKSLDEKIEKTIQMNEKMYSQKERYDKSISEKEEKIIKLKANIIDLEASKPDKGEIKARVLRLRSELELLSNSQADGAVAIRSLSEQKEKQQKEISRISEFNEGECPFCYRDFCSDDKNEVASKLEKELEKLELRKGKLELEQKEITEKVEECKRNNKAAEKEKDDYNKFVEEKKHLITQCELHIESLDQTKAMLKDTADVISSYEEQLIEEQELLEAKQAELEKLLPFDEDDYNKINQKITNLNSDLSIKDKNLRELEVTKGRNESSILDTETKISKLKKSKEEKAKLIEKKKVYDELAVAFGKKGIQALILENVAVQLEQLINELLSEISTDVSVEIKTQREGKHTDNIQETFDIIITDKFHTSPYELYSGGEKFRIAFALRIALSKLLSTRCGVELGAIFYDEAFSDLDTDGVEKLIDIFMALSRDFPYQLIISHQDEVKSMFSDIVVVNKTSDGSTITQ